MAGYYVRRTSDALAHYGVKGMKWGVRKTPILRPTTLGKTGVQAVVGGASGGLAELEEDAIPWERLLTEEQKQKRLHKRYLELMKTKYLRGVSASEAAALEKYIKDMNEKLAPQNRMIFQIQSEGTLEHPKDTYTVVNTNGGWESLQKVTDKEEKKSAEERVRKMNENKLSTKTKKAKNYIVKRSKKLGKQIGNLFD